ncbi:MAG: hypothetical protein OEX07_02945 [Gammaproteobacteria bacterium]|nr:hypothetical protein [Gammaproteobacteria bacterium]
MASQSDFKLVEDKNGLVWDLVLYVPTLIALAILSSKYWYGGDEEISYVLVFLTTFIFLIAFNRIFKTRLMILPSSPVSFSVSKNGVSVVLKNGESVELVKEVRFFTDMAGKSFGLAGVDLEGAKKQFVFHKGQFADTNQFDDSKARLRAFK